MFIVFNSHCHAETTEEVCNMHSQCFLRVNLVACGFGGLYCVGCDSVSVKLMMMAEVSDSVWPFCCVLLVPVYVFVV